jgi:hypothetical protein
MTTQYRNIFYSIYQKDAEPEEDLVKDGMIMGSQRKFDWLNHEVKKK